ncbi:ATP-grasp domain-containing protein [Halobacteriovorax sp. HLS]|uniref:ATP-grasp domain-containing protein n=1 Tax=Halobacteriovorax sp. HLS TaxID=2234000 RepID=UPI000FDAE8BC|nr:ATP-grasp domain-containing protein [Halobacteriovorax sp. HLS]
MTVLLMGFRSGAARALEKMKVPYIIWSEKELLNSRTAKKIIIDKFPVEKNDLQIYLSDLSDVTHVISSTEAGVIPGSKIRKWLDLHRNKDSVITRCTDKLEMKKFLSQKNIPMTKFLPSRAMKAEDIVGELGLPVVNKVRLSSGGRGVQFLSTLEEVESSMSRDSYFEKPLDGTEGSIESFVINGEIVFTNITQYFKNGECNIVPGQYTQQINEKIEELNSNVLSALRIKWGMTHLEYYLLDNGEILFGEVALRPPGGYIMEALKESYGINFWELFINVEINMQKTELKFKKSNSSTIIIHPGEGTVSSITGIDKIKKLESFKKLKLKINIGDKIDQRDGVGEDYGHAIMTNTNSKNLLRDIKSFYSLLEITL